jgi:hypothetical protein
MPKLYEISLTRLPQSILNFPDKLAELGITWEEPKPYFEPLVEKMRYPEHLPVNVIFPDGWKLSSRETFQGEAENHEFFDSTKTLRLTILASLLPYDNRIDITFWTPDTRAEKRVQDLHKMQKFIEMHFGKTWSKQHNTLVFYHVPGSRFPKKEHWIGFSEWLYVDKKIYHLERLIDDAGYTAPGAILREQLDQPVECILKVVEYCARLRNKFAEADADDDDDDELESALMPLSAEV